jgi:hypothetical protein
MTPLEAELLRRQVAATYGPTAALGNVGDYFFKKGGAGPLQKAFSKDTAALTKMIPGVSNRAAVKVGQFAGRAAPLLSAVGNVADVADLVTSDDGLDNKLVDAAGMGIGGTLGFVLGGGPLGASVGASLGKTVTDGIQGMFFSEPTKEEKLAEALALLQGGRI